MSKTWHYDRTAPPENDLSNCGNILIPDSVNVLIDKMLLDPIQHGGYKRIHSGDPALHVTNSSINNRSAHMRQIGFNENHFFMNLMMRDF